MAIVLSLGISCSKNNVNPEPIENVPVNLTLNLALPSNSHLLDPGTHLYQTGGVKGIVVVHHLDGEYYAFDRCCSYQPSSACARVEVDSSLLVFRCGESKSGGFEKCCDSKFYMNGDVINGPATFGLKRYQVILDGNLLNVKN